MRRFFCSEKRIPQAAVPLTASLRNRRLTRRLKRRFSRRPVNGYISCCRWVPVNTVCGVKKSSLQTCISCGSAFYLFRSLDSFSGPTHTKSASTPTQQLPASRFFAVTAGCPGKIQGLGGGANQIVWFSGLDSPENWSFRGEPGSEVGRIGMVGAYPDRRRSEWVCL